MVFEAHPVLTGAPSFRSRRGIKNRMTEDSQQRPRRIRRRRTRSDTDSSPRPDADSRRESSDTRSSSENRRSSETRQRSGGPRGPRSRNENRDRADSSPGRRPSRPRSSDSRGDSRSDSRGDSRVRIPDRVHAVTLDQIPVAVRVRVPGMTDLPAAGGADQADPAMERGAPMETREHGDDAG